MALTVPLERISSEARRVDVRPGLLALARLLATLVVGVPYVAAWLVSKAWRAGAWVLGVAWLGLSMLWAAAVAGWRDAARPGAEGGSET